MGLIKSAKATGLARDAQHAIEDGRRTFTPLLNTPAFNAGLSGAIDTWSTMIDAIEAEGWRLEHWAIGQDKQGKPQAYPLFRRI